MTDMTRSPAGPDRRAQRIEAYPLVLASRYDADFQAIYGGPSPEGPSADRGDLGFFVSLARAEGGPVVEVGAGTGRVLLAIAGGAPGVGPIVGVEPSSAMRESFAERRDAAGLSTQAVDIRAGHFGQLPVETRSCALAFSAFRSFQHLLSPRAQLEALAELRRVLRPGGLLALDFFYPHPELLTDAPWTLALERPLEGGGVVRRWDRRRVDHLRQRVSVGFRWEERDGRGACHRVRSGYRVRYVLPAELRHLLARAGFRDVRLRGGYAGEPLTAEASSIVLTARAPARRSAQG